LSVQYERLINWLQQQALSAVLVSKRINVRYFSGFAGSAGVLVVSPTIRKLFVDFRYVEQARQTAPEYETVKCQSNPLDAAVEYLQQQNLDRIGFEAEDLTVADFRRITSVVAEHLWIPSVLDSLRVVKSAEEIAKIETAAQILDQAFAKILPQIRPGIAENSLAAILEYEMRQLGSERTGFATIVASGPRSALPHGVAADRLLATGDLVVFDFGAVFDGYHSDMTRTVCLGPANDRQRQIYDTVLSAQMAGLAAVRPGALCREVDGIARGIIAEAGFGDFFGHGLGHSVGLAIHENPRLSPLAGEARLEAGMVVTVEPGIYLPEWGGVRIEDLVVVTADGCRILSHTTKQLLELS
jgi:Xaa-Pro aminopeptidase